jgi:hypothetical protein
MFLERFTYEVATASLSAPFRRLSLQQMALSRAALLELAALRHADAFRYGLVGLQFTAHTTSPSYLERHDDHE